MPVPDTLARLRHANLIAVVRADRPEHAVRVTAALLDGGISAIELTFTIPGAAEALISQPTAIAKVPESERVDARRLADDIAAAGTPARWLEGPDAIVALLAREAKPGDVILAMSNGGFGGLHKKLLEALAAP